MPRKKALPKFKYTVRKKDKDDNPLALYVKFPQPGSKYPVWRICRDETQEAVNDIIEQIKTDHAKEAAKSVVPDSCAQFFAFYLKTIKNRISARTLSKRESKIRLYLQPALGALALKEVKPIHLQKLYSELSNRGLDAATVIDTHRIASNIFKEAENLEMIPSNPARKATPPKKTDSLKIKAMSLEEVRRFSAECQKSDYGIIFEFALETGMRPQEYLALRWTDIDLEKQTARVLRALVYDQKGGGYYFKETKTKRSRRTIPLSKYLVEKLLLHKEKQTAYIDEVKERVRRRYKPSRESRREYNKQILDNHKKLNLLFPSQDFTPFKDINISRRYFKTIAEDAGLSPDLSLYSLRHTCCSVMIAAGVNIKVVSERMGHSSVAFSLDVYSHVLPGQQEEGTAKLSSILYE